MQLGAGQRHSVLVSDSDLAVAGHWRASCAKS